MSKLLQALKNKQQALESRHYSGAGDAIPAGGEATIMRYMNLDPQVLLQSYRDQRNPEHLDRRHAEAGQYAGEALRRMGYDLSGVQSHATGGKVLKGGLGRVVHDIGSGLGSALKVAAPLAGFIPGIGVPLAALVAAGGSAAGGALHGDRFNLGKTLLAGAAGAGGAALSGGSGAASAGSAAGQGSAGLGSAGLGGAANTAAFANAAPLAAAAPAASAAPGILGKIGGYISAHPGKVARLGFGALGAIQGSQQQGKADDLIRRSLAPLNQPNPYADLNVGAFGNPYSQPAQMSGRASLRRELMR